MLFCSGLHRKPFKECPSVFNVAHISSFVSSTHSLNFEEWGTDQWQSLWHCKVMVLWNHVFLIDSTLDYQLGTSIQAWLPRSGKSLYMNTNVYSLLAFWLIVRGSRIKVSRIADERCFHTERETIDRLLLIHACTLIGADQQCIFPQICISYMDLTPSTAQYTALN